MIQTPEWCGHPAREEPRWAFHDHNLLPSPSMAGSAQSNGIGSSSATPGSSIPASTLEVFGFAANGTTGGISVLPLRTDWLRARQARLEAVSNWTDVPDFASPRPSSICRRAGPRPGTLSARPGHGSSRAADCCWSAATTSASNRRSSGSRANSINRPRSSPTGLERGSRAGAG